ncbi:MAG: hypothetical protein V7636_2312 [Actinomycetota bacterium]
MIDDDELAVELVADDGGMPRTRRWPLLVLLGAVIAVVVLVGGLDDGGHETAIPTTTSTLRTTTTQHSTTTGTYVATTTSLPRFESGTGALLPGATGTFIVTTDGELVTVIDLSTGARCMNLAGDGAWIPFRSGPITGRAVIGTPRGVATVDARCSVVQLGGGAEGYPVAIGADGVWMVEPSSGSLIEHRYDSAGGNSIPLPANTGPSAVEVDGRVVVALNGSMTLVDPATGRRRDLGAGMPVTAHGSTLAYTTCPSLECSIVLLDVRTGARRTIAAEDLAANSIGAAVFSNDGRYLGLAGANGHGAIVDVRTRQVTRLDLPSIAGFTADAAWVLIDDGSRMYAVRPDGTEQHPITAASRSSNGVAVLLAPPDY